MSSVYDQTSDISSTFTGVPRCGLVEKDKGKTQENTIVERSKNLLTES